LLLHGTNAKHHLLTWAQIGIADYLACCFRARFLLLPRCLDFRFSLTVKWRLSIALCLLLLSGPVISGRSDVVKSAFRSDGLLDFVFDLSGQEVPDKYPLQLRSTAFAQIAVGHAREDQSGRVLVSGLAQRRFGGPSFGPNARIEVVVHGRHNELLERTSTDCYLRSPGGHGLTATCHFAVFLRTVPPPESAIEISCRPG
jgi:hypothetical protein